MKMPPIDKIPEAYSAIEDQRVTLSASEALVSSSDGAKQYTIRWNGQLYYSNDNSTYWQSYPGYPVIAILMLRGILPLNHEVSVLFKGINWKELNTRYKNDYTRALAEVLQRFTDDEQKKIADEMESVYKEIEKLDLQFTRKKSI